MAFCNFCGKKVQKCFCCSKIEMIREPEKKKKKGLKTENKSMADKIDIEVVESETKII